MNVIKCHKGYQKTCQLKALIIHDRRAIEEEEAPLTVPVKQKTRCQYNG